MEKSLELSTKINENEQNTNFIYDNNKDKKELLIENKEIKIEIPNKNNKKKFNKKNNLDKFSDSKKNQLSKNYFYKKIGNSFSFFGNKNGDPLIIIGPNWHFYICFSFTMSALYFFVFVNFWNFITYTPKLIGIIIYLIFFISYTYTFLINPGYPKHDIDSRRGEPRNIFTYCRICKIWVNQQKNTSHCEICNICIEGNDHHCVWTSKCIGKGNIVSFHIFVIFTFFALGHAIITLFLVRIQFFKSKEMI